LCHWYERSMKRTSSRVVLTPTPGLTEEQARDARAWALRFAIDRYLEKQEAADASPGGLKSAMDGRVPLEAHLLEVKDEQDADAAAS
jgi:hypothetical protein